MTDNLKRTVEQLNTSPQAVKIWNPSETEQLIDRLQEIGLPVVLKRTRVLSGQNYVFQNVEYYNIPVAFDIETTSYTTSEGQKCGIMYVWQMCIAGEIIIGRTWKEFVDFINRLRERLQLGKERRLVIYVHNLSFEMQHIKHLFAWDEVFAVRERMPAYAVTNGIEFKCSYLLSGYPLSKLSDSLHVYKCRKAVGDLDYSLIRHSETPLTQKELHYCIMDVIVVAAYIDEQIDAEGGIYKIPLTKTGRVRRYCRENTVSPKDKEEQKNARRYRDLISTLTLTPLQYDTARKCAQGGFTHANAYKVGKTYYNVYSHDETSAYPSVMVCEKYPMSAPVDITNTILCVADLEDAIKKNALIIDIGFVNLESTVIQERILSASKCTEAVGMEKDNGRVVRADRVRTIITDVDYVCLKKFYSWTGIKVFKVYAMRRSYLPTAFVKCVIEMYTKKTTLKNVAGKEFEYGLNKEMVNSAFGMSYMPVIRDDTGFDTEEGEWAKTMTPEEKAWIPGEWQKIIDDYNDESGRFLYYLWSIYITAYARKNVFSAILELGTDYIYSDTDSVKYLNHEAHAAYFEKYNRNIEKKMQKAMAAHGLPENAWKPKTVKGVEKPLGFWDREPDMLAFKTLGAKRYIYMDTERNLHITIAGVNKKRGAEYLERRFGKYGAFRAFDYGLEIPPEWSGSMTHYYIDKPVSGVIVDYMGNVSEFETLSGVFLENSSYIIKDPGDYRFIRETLIEHFFTIRKDR